MKGLKSLGKVLAVILCIVYCFCLIAFISMSFAGKLLSGSYYAKVLQDIDLKEIKLSDLGDFSNVSNLSGDATLEDALVETLKEGDVDEKTAYAIVENNEIRGIVGNYIGEYINYNFGGEKPIIVKEDVEKVLMNPDVIKAIGKIPTAKDIDSVYDQLNGLITEIEEEDGVNNAR